VEHLKKRKERGKMGAKNEAWSENPKAKLSESRDLVGKKEIGPRSNRIDYAITSSRYLSARNLQGEECCVRNREEKKNTANSHSKFGNKRKKD